MAVDVLEQAARRRDGTASADSAQSGIEQDRNERTNQIAGEAGEGTRMAAA